MCPAAEPGKQVKLSFASNVFSDAFLVQCCETWFIASK
jgi:hypothetical protein